MYELFVLACLMQQPNMCVTLKDLYSPHQTHDKCLARAYEIAMELPEYMPNYYALKYRCVIEKGKIKTTWQENVKEVD